MVSPAMAFAFAVASAHAAAPLNGVALSQLTQDAEPVGRTQKISLLSASTAEVPNEDTIAVIAAAAAFPIHFAARRVVISVRMPGPTTFFASVKGATGFRGHLSARSMPQ